jgi:hypothetical protein
MIEEAPENVNWLESKEGVARSVEDNIVLSPNQGEPGRFRGATLKIFTCVNEESYCVDLGVKSLPTVRLYKGSEVISERIGAVRLPMLLQWLLDAMKESDNPNPGV